MKDFEISVGKRLRELREKQGYSRERLSEMAEITPKFLYEIESGRKGMSAYTLYNLSAALNVSCDYLLTGKNSGMSFGYIINMLSTLDKNGLQNVEQIIKYAVILASNGKK